MKEHTQEVVLTSIFADCKTGGDDPQFGRLVHEDRYQDDPRSRAQDHYASNDQQHQGLYHGRIARQPLRHGRYGSE